MPKPKERYPKLFKNLTDWPFVSFNDFRIFLTTYNINNRTSSKYAGLSQAVKQWLQIDALEEFRPQMVVICLQECGTVNRFRSALKPVDSRTRREWNDLIIEHLGPLKLVKCCDIYVGCTYMVLFLREPFLNTFSLIDKAAYPMGFCWDSPCQHVRKLVGMKEKCVMGDKGACLVKFKIQKQVFLLVGVHLAAHDSHHQERYRQIDTLCEEYSDWMESSHFTFWLGDFNFRTAACQPIPDDASFLSGNQENAAKLLNEYLQEDEDILCRKETKDKPNHFFKAFEARIKFPPTYKHVLCDDNSLNVDEDFLNYDMTHRPSWCDRIYCHSSDKEARLKIRKYGSEHRCLLSDHKPVFAMVKLKLEFMEYKRWSRNKSGDASPLPPAETVSSSELVPFEPNSSNSKSVQDSSRSMDDDEVFDVKAANKLTLLAMKFWMQCYSKHTHYGKWTFRPQITSWEQK